MCLTLCGAFAHVQYLSPMAEFAKVVISIGAAYGQTSSEEGKWCSFRIADNSGVFRDRYELSSCKAPMISALT